MALLTFAATMIGRFCRLSRLVVFCVGALAFYIFINVLKLLLVSDDDAYKVISCKNSAELVENLLSLGSKTDAILETFNITHFLCYGTLWGALRHSELLPWKRNLDICVMNEDVIKLDEVFFRRQFNKQAMTIEYDSANGVYTIWNDNRRPDVDGVLNIFVFEALPELKLVRRIGYKNRLMPPTSNSVGSFPIRLITYPLSSIMLNSRRFPAPREGLEIQKYHYMKDWWKEIKPAQCA